jgi:hypothetical protein
MKTPYEGEKVPDGEYQLGQLSRSGYGRVLKMRDDPDYDLYNDMPVAMTAQSYKELYESYVGKREGSIRQFTAVVKNHEIIHIY